MWLRNEFDIGFRWRSRVDLRRPGNGAAMTSSSKISSKDAFQCSTPASSAAQETKPWGHGQGTVQYYMPEDGIERISEVSKEGDHDTAPQVVFRGRMTNVCVVTEMGQEHRPLSQLDGGAFRQNLHRKRQTERACKIWYTTRCVQSSEPRGPGLVWIARDHELRVF